MFYSRYFWLLTEILLTSLYQDLQGNHCTNDTVLGLSGVKSHCSRNPALKDGPALIAFQGIPSDDIWTGLYSKLKCDIFLFFSPSFCVSWSSKHIFGVLRLRDVILEVWSVTDHKSPVSLLSAWLSSLSNKCRWAREHWRNRGHLVSVLRVLDQD